MVGSAGNKSTSSSLRITSPKTAYNYITVGNSGSTVDTRISSSCYAEYSGYGASKPNLMAPGTTTTNALSGTGTSYASPQVVGCLALLMEEFPFLIAYPELCLSIVTSSASPMSSNYNDGSGINVYDDSGLHNEIGSGLLNYEKMREAANNYVSVIRNINSPIEELNETLEFYAKKNQRVRASLAWLASGTDSNNFTNYDLYLQRKNDDGTFFDLMYVDGSDNNVEFLDYSFDNNGIYRLVIKQKEINVKKDYIAMSYVLINSSIGGSCSGAKVAHTCNNYIETTVSDDYHIIKCNCGYYENEEHNKLIENGILKCDKCSWFNINNSYELTNYKSMINKNFVISADSSDLELYELYELNSSYTKYYEIYINSINNLNIRLYNEDFDLVTILDLNEYDTIYHFIYHMPTGSKYFLSVGFENSDSVGIINTKIVSRNTTYLSYNQNDILVNTYNEIDNYYYNNKMGAGFYEFTLIGTRADGTTITYPTGSIKIYSDSSKTTPMDKFTLSGYSNQAVTGINKNSMIVYLSRDGYFYLDVNMTSNGLASLKLNITSVDSQELDLFALSESTSESITILSETTKGDYFRRLDIKQAGKFSVNVNYSGSTAIDMLFMLTKLNYNNSSNTYSLTTKIIELMNNDNDSYFTTLSLTDGTYYIGYFNKNDVSNFNVTFNRLVIQSGSSVLVTDSDFDTLCGSQINIIEMNQTTKSYRETFIIKGFTRLIYLESIAPSTSRLEYYWYSSDESKAIVTDYGTVLGKDIGMVKIMGVYKYDPSKVFVKEFTIINDLGTTPLTIESTIKVKYSQTNNGTFLLPLEKANCPYPRFQDYSWNLFIPCQENSPSVTYNSWGYFTISEPGSFILTGSYYLNSIVTVVIHVIVEE